LQLLLEQQTNQKIRDLIPPGALQRDTGMVLVNAIYFKGRWLKPFPEEQTREEPFYLQEGGNVPVQLMHDDRTAAYTHSDGFQMIELDYEDSDLSMLVLLPDKKDGLSDLEKRLSAHLLSECLQKVGVYEVDIFLPRFKLLWGTVDVGAQLRALGMPMAFDPKEADFSGINGYKPLEKYAHYISAVFHQALVEVNEKGTEAAAATEVFAPLGNLEPESIPTAVFRADHPFLFAIRDRRSGAILFLGRVADPTR
jgi:serpin B